MSVLTERDISKVWQHQLLDRAELVTEGGEPIEIIYPGRINDDQGADFRDAVIATKGRLAKGDIEVHVKSSDWRAHQHHQNAAYNRVILHVVMWHNTKTATNLENGEKVPILELHKYIKGQISRDGLATSPPNPLHLISEGGVLGERGQSPLSNPSIGRASPSPSQGEGDKGGEVNKQAQISHSPTLSMPCFEASKRLTTGTVDGFLDRAGEERFLAKAARFQADLTGMEANQCLYQGIMGALGYSKNKSTFLELACGLPLQILESMTQGGIPDKERLVWQQALLLGAAGLLPSQRPGKQWGSGLDDPWIDELERLWNSSRYTQLMSYSDWHLFKVRPNNSPVRRLVAMSYLLLRYRERGIFEELVSMVREVPLSQGCRRLGKGLVVTADGYWASHFDFGSGNRIRSQTLLGSERAAIITVNVLLPFTFAWSQFTSQPELGRKALDLYHRYSRLAVNAVERHMMAQLGLNSSLVNSAQRQQGLVQLHNNLCTQGRCSACSLRQVEVGVQSMKPGMPAEPG